MSAKIDRIKIETPIKRGKVLLHSCCAPCSGEIIEAMLFSGIEFSIFFYNPNIYPQSEYEIRKQEITRYAEKVGVPIIDADYEVDEWIQRTKGMENEPERGARCTICFEMRLERTARYAHENGLPMFATSLGISRWKNMLQVNECGFKAAAKFPNLVYWDYNWRKKGGSNRMAEITIREGFYRQNYCGCSFSLRDAEAYHQAKSKNKGLNI